MHTLVLSNNNNNNKFLEAKQKVGPTNHTNRQPHSTLNHRLETTHDTSKRYIKLTIYTYLITVLSKALPLTNLIGTQNGKKLSRKYKESNKGGYGPSTDPTSNHWKIVTQNINRLNDKLKQNKWWDFCMKMQFDIVLLTETRLKEKTTKYTFLENKIHAKQRNLPYYECYWASGKRETREAGVGFMIRDDLAKHVYKVEQYHDRGISLQLSFWGKITLYLIGIYEYANKMERVKSGKALTSWIGKQISNANQKHHAAIILGDFNGVANPKLDRIDSALRKTETRTLEAIINRIDSALRKTETRTLEAIINKGFQDCYRLINGKKREFTFFNRDTTHNRKPVNRIDQI
ncbi:hypothetical protein Glove_146g4 [Diversispora epigaea]|uniref:Endonuclease/exonuclease/phosphatase domain-containing protein n=1 Tax=Diversispora epigaea TaxID=1348612 RepID=A0A397J3H2_9GLOM|nr:hypothetical protein Glove_146g4 [Diversispora epigaea]